MLNDDTSTMNSTGCCIKTTSKFSIFSTIRFKEIANCERCTQNNLISSKFYDFSSCLKLIQNQNMKKSFSIKTIIFSCIYYVFMDTEL